MTLGSCRHHLFGKGHSASKSWSCGIRWLKDRQICECRWDRVYRVVGVCKSQVADLEHCLLYSKYVAHRGRLEDGTVTLPASPKSRWYRLSGSGEPDRLVGNLQVGHGLRKKTSRFENRRSRSFLEGGQKRNCLANAVQHDMPGEMPCSEHVRPVKAAAPSAGRRYRRLVSSWRLHMCPASVDSRDANDDGSGTIIVRSFGRGFLPTPGTTALASCGASRGLLRTFSVRHFT